MTWAEGYSHAQRWLTLAARLEGLIEAHRVLKGGQTDEHDEMLYRLAAEYAAECEQEGGNG